jgi:hypothetical protein
MRNDRAARLTGCAAMGALLAHVLCDQTIVSASGAGAGLATGHLVLECDALRLGENAIDGARRAGSSVEGIGGCAVDTNAPLDTSDNSRTNAANLPDGIGNVYLSERQFCDRYHVAPRTAQRWRVTGYGPPFVRLGPRKISYRLSDTEQWAASRTFKHRAQELAQSVRAVTVPNAPSRNSDRSGEHNRSSEDNVSSSRAACAPGKVTGEAP